MDTSKAKALLGSLSGLAISADPADRGPFLWALETSLSLLKSRLAIAEAAGWFLDQRTAEDGSQANADFWASHVTPQAASELRELIPRLLVLYGEHRRCSLVGNSSAMWAYSAIAIMPEPADDALQGRILEELFEDVVSKKNARDFAPEQICQRAVRRAPKEAVALLHFEHELPDARQGHEMMRLGIGLHEAVLYWPQIDDAEYNFVDLEVLSETCERLSLQHVRPMQLAAFFSVIGYASADHTESWGGEMGAHFFDPGNIPYVLKKYPDDDG